MLVLFFRWPGDEDKKDVCLTLWIKVEPGPFNQMLPSSSCCVACMFQCVQLSVQMYNFIIAGCRCFWSCFLHYAPTPEYDLSKLIQHPVQNTLLEAMNDPDCGIYVHWGIRGSGKTAYATALANELRKKGGRLVFVLDSHSLSHPRSAAAISKFCDVLPLRARSFELNPLEPPPTTIIIDDFDSCEEWEQHRSMVQTLAKQSRTLKRFNLLLLVSSAECARAVIEWDWTRIRWTSETSMWRKEHVVELIGSTYPALMSADDYAERLRLCTQAGTPGFVVWSARMKRIGQTTLAAARGRAEKSEKEWAEGLGMLNSV